jgi:hypothetical protein
MSGVGAVIRSPPLSIGNQSKYQQIESSKTANTSPMGMARQTFSTNVHSARYNGVQSQNKGHVKAMASIDLSVFRKKINK